MSSDGQRDLLREYSLVENGNRQLKRWLSKMGEKSRHEGLGYRPS